MRRAPVLLNVARALTFIEGAASPNRFALAKLTGASSGRRQPYGMIRSSRRRG